MLLDPNHLSALSAILRHGSFEAAAADLSVTPSAISQRIKALEDRVGAALIHRGSPCTATPAGLRIARHAEDIGLLETQLARELTLDAGSDLTRVRIALPADVLATWFLKAIAQVDHLLFDLVVDDQDHSADWLRRGEVSAAITVGGQPVTGCDTTALGALPYIATASPAYMGRWFPNGVTESAIARAPCLTFNQKDGLQKDWLLRQFGRKLSPPTHFLPSPQGFVQASMAGMGWGMNPLDLARAPLADGRLVPVLPDAPLVIPLAWQVGRVLTPALAPLTAAVKRVAKEVLQPA